jgi:hydroxymethylbilane synthase
MLPAPGQGALAVQCRAGDERLLELLAAIDDPAARATTTAERAFLNALGAGCAAPVAAHAVSLPRQADNASNSLLQSDRGVHMRGLVASPDGRDVVRVDGEGEPDEVGTRLAREALAIGADAILRAIRG